MSKPLKFLLVGQNVDGRVLLGRTLIRQFPQAAAIECADREAAMNLAKSDVFCAVVVHDVSGADAETLVRSIRQVNSSVPVVMVSGADCTSEAVAGGADRFLHQDRWLMLGRVIEELLTANGRAR